MPFSTLARQDLRAAFDQLREEQAKQPQQQTVIINAAVVFNCPGLTPQQLMELALAMQAAQVAAPAAPVEPKCPAG